MEQNKTLSGLICDLVKEGYRIRIEQFINDDTCTIEVYKNESRWTKIVPYELLSRDDYLISILEFLESKMKQLEYWADRNVATKSSPFMEVNQNENGR